jgi:hypothetical protein
LIKQTVEHRRPYQSKGSLKNNFVELFRNFGGHGNQLAMPRILLIDSVQFKFGDALDKNCRTMAAAEIKRFRYEMRERGDVLHPNREEVRSDNADGIACWFIDTDYNEESFFVRHAVSSGPMILIRR